MRRIWIQRLADLRAFLAALLLLPGLAAFAQDAEPEEPDTDVEASAELDQDEADEADEAAEDGASDDEPTEDPPSIDGEYYGDVDDEDFLPSEEIPADQSIAFPTDI